MSASGLPIFDETVQLTNLWLNELMEAVDWDDKQRAYRLLRATLHGLRDRLSAQAAVHLGAQLPILVRGFYYDGWHMRDTILKERTKSEFLSHIEAAFSRTPTSTLKSWLGRFSSFWRAGSRAARSRT